MGKDKIFVEEADQRTLLKLKSIPNRMEEVLCSRHVSPLPRHLLWKEELPCVLVSLDDLGRQVKKLMVDHGGSIPLASLPHCHSSQFTPLATLTNEKGIPLEHLLQAVSNVAIVAGGAGRVKRLVDTSSSPKEFHCIEEAWPPPPSMTNQLIAFSKEAVDLLRATPNCHVPLCKFVSDYQLRFDKDFRVADYGYTRLRDLLDSIPHVIQVLGEGERASLTISHQAQVKRFANDLQKVLKIQPERKLLLSNLPKAFTQCFQTHFNVLSYGVCYTIDILKEVPEGIFLVERTFESEDFLISEFKRNQTAEEMRRVNVFAKEVRELLCHCDLSISFPKFIPAYHQYFGRQCKVSNYGVAKLTELFECIPHTVQVVEINGERKVQLSHSILVEVIGEQVGKVVKEAGGDRGLPLHLLASEFETRVGKKLPLAALQVADEKDLLALLTAYVRLEIASDEEVISLLDGRDTKALNTKVSQITLKEGVCEMEWDQFREQGLDRSGINKSGDSLMKDTGYPQMVKDGIVGPTPVRTVHSHNPSLANRPPGASAGFSTRPSVAAFSGRGFDMLRLVSPPALSQVCRQLNNLSYILILHMSNRVIDIPFQSQV